MNPQPRSVPTKTPDRKISFATPREEVNDNGAVRPAKPKKSKKPKSEHIEVDDFENPEDFARRIREGNERYWEEQRMKDRELKAREQEKSERRKAEMSKLREKAQKELGTYNPPKPKEEYKKYVPSKDDPAILKKTCSKVTIADIKQLCPAIENLKDTRGIKAQWDKVRKNLGVSGNIGEFIRCYILSAGITEHGEMAELLNKFEPREDLRELVSSRMPAEENKSNNTSAKPEPSHKSQPKIDKSDQEILDKQLKDIDMDDLKTVFPQIRELDEDDIVQQWNDLCECLGNDGDDTMRVFIEDYGKNALSMWEGREKLYFDGRIINDIFFRFEPREDLFKAITPETFAKKRTPPAEVTSAGKKKEPRIEHKTHPKVDESIQHILDKQLTDFNIDDLKSIFPNLSKARLSDNTIMDEWEALCNELCGLFADKMINFIGSYKYRVDTGNYSIFHSYDKYLFNRFRPREDLLNAVSNVPNTREVEIMGTKYKITQWKPVMK